MKRSKLLGLTLMAMLALTSITATTASAETQPNILPAGSVAEPVLSTTLSGTSVFGSGTLASITSTSSLGTSQGTSETGGKFKTQFLHTEGALGVCTGAADTTTGTVTVEGTFEVVDADIAELLKVAVLFKLNPQVEFTCGSTKIAVEGCAEGQLTPETELTTLLLVNLEVSGSDNVMTSYLVSGTTELCLLLSKAGVLGKTELSAEKTLQDLSGFRKNGGALTEVLVMPL